MSVDCITRIDESDDRSALVGSGKKGEHIPVLFAEPWPEQRPADKAAKEALLQELKDLASEHWQTNTIEHFDIHIKLPVDIRHNSKIFREQMRPLADDIVAR